MSSSKLFFVLFLISVSPQARSDPISPKKHPPPSITFQWWLPDGEGSDSKWLLIGNLPEAAKNEIFVDEGNDTFTFGDTALGWAINCSAPYPVEWVPQLHKGLMDSSVFGVILGSDISFLREFGDINDPSSYKYTSLVKVTRTFKELTGNYSCQAADKDPTLRKSIFVYVEGENRVQTLILAGKKIEISLDDQQVVTFPCAAASPREEVLLQKLAQSPEGVMDYEAWPPLAPKDAVVFDPKVGFIINLRHFSPNDILGSYRCRGITDEDAVHVEVTVSHNPGQIEESSALNSKAWKAYVQAPASLDYDNPQQSAGVISSSVTCCSNSLKPPLAIGLPCFSINHCQLFDFLDYQTVSSMATDRLLSRNFGIFKSNGNCTTFRANMIYTRVICKGDGINVDSILTQTYQSTGNSKKSAALMLDNSGQSVSDFKKAMIFVYDNLPGDPNSAAKTYRKLSDGETLDVYSSQKISLVCSCFNFGLANGVSSTWSINYGDSHQFIQNPPLENDIYKRLRKILGELLTVSVRSGSSNASEKSLTCHCPLAKEPGWVQTTVNLNYTEPLEPRIIVLNEAEEYWTMNSSNKQIRCKVSGSPTPEVIWKKDGKVLKTKPTSRVWNATYSKDTGIAVLQFKSIPTSIHGLYTCMAKNLVGTASSSIKVYVEATHSTVVYWVSGMLIVSAFLLLGIVILKTRKSVHKVLHKNTD